MVVGKIVFDSIWPAMCKSILYSKSLNSSIVSEAQHLFPSLFTLLLHLTCRGSAADVKDPAEELWSGNA